MRTAKRKTARSSARVRSGQADARAPAPRRSSSKADLVRALLADPANAKLTSTEVARRAGVSLSLVSKLRARVRPEFGLDDIPELPDYDDIRMGARALGVPVDDLLALSAKNDPFYADRRSRRISAEWFMELWERFELDRRSGRKHLRLIHYILVSQPQGTVKLPDNMEP
jgi:hypothetical protein